MKTEAMLNPRKGGMSIERARASVFGSIAIMEKSEG